GNRAEQKEDLRQLVGLTAGSDDKALLADITLRRASMYLATADYEQAVKQAQQATALVATHDNKTLEARAYRIWGRAQWQQGRANAAKPLLQRALRLATAAKDVLEQAQNYYDLGQIAFLNNQFSEAQQLLHQAIDLFKVEDDKRNMIRCLDNLGSIAILSESNFEAALTYFQDSFRMCQSIHWPYGETYVLYHLGNCYFEIGDFAQSQETLGKTLTLTRLLGDRAAEANALDTLGLAYQFDGQLEQARAKFEEALAIHDSLNDRRGKAYVQTHLGILLSNLEEIEQAGIYLYDALSARSDSGAKETTIDTEAALAWLDMARGDSDFAQERAQEIAAWLQENGTAGVELPFQVFWQCYTVLKLTGAAEEAQSLLQLAYTQLMARTQKIQDEDLRAHYLESVVYHRQIIEAFEATTR
ncbi:MAG: tetratricopeptide repeat protein, partial [Anaerolineales bacterium]|nr:tetratricopeptide repeat protein [Anaerolineales bacterium]